MKIPLLNAFKRHKMKIMLCESSFGDISFKEQKLNKREITDKFSAKL